MSTLITYALPNGEITTDANEYVRQWKEIYDPLCRAIGAGILGYGSVAMIDFDNGVVASIPRTAFDEFNRRKIKPNRTLFLIPEGEKK